MLLRATNERNIFYNSENEFFSFAFYYHRAMCCALLAIADVWRVEIQKKKSWDARRVSSRKKKKRTLKSRSLEMYVGAQGGGKTSSSELESERKTHTEENRIAARRSMTMTMMEAHEIPISRNCVVETAFRLFKLLGGG
jgi:hypothetical protein